MQDQRFSPLRPIAIAWPVLVVALFCGPLLAAPRNIQEIMEEYVGIGVASNLALANNSLEIEKNQAALTAARARFFPELGLSARYTRADGGRQIALPLGQLLNPAYQTLNELLVAQGAMARFPVVADQSIPLQLPREQDTRITLRQPVYSPAIVAGLHAARANLTSVSYTRAAYQRTLRRDIALAYLDWLKSTKSTEILSASVELLAENLRVNQALFSNGKGTRDTVLRAQAEEFSAEQQQREAQNGVIQARSYLNFLLNRPLETSLESPVDALSSEGPTGIGRASDAARATRPELLALEAAELAAEAQLKGAHAARRPSLALGIDAGSEGVDYGLGRNYNFITGSLVLTWTLFDAGARAAAVSQARLASKQLANQRQQLAARIDLEIQQASDGLRSAADSVRTANARAEAAHAAFTIAHRRRDAGMATPLEFLDARSELTGADLNRSLTYYTLLQQQAEFEFARGDLP